MNRHMHGTYDRAGTFHPQTVRLGVTQSGQHGLFSCGCLAWPLKQSEYEALRTYPTRELRAYVQSKGFELDAPAAD